MKWQKLTLIAVSSMLLFSCVSSGKFKSLQKNYDELNTSYKGVQNDLAACRDEKA